MDDPTSPFQKPITLESMAARLVVLEAMAFTANSAVAEAILKTQGPEGARAHIETIAHNIGVGMQTLPGHLQEEARSYATMLLGALEGVPLQGEAASLMPDRKN